MVILNGEYLDPGKIADSGQCFRWQRVDEHTYRVPAFGRELIIAQRGDEVTLDCSQPELDSTWGAYLDIDGDYDGYHRAAIGSGLPFLADAANFSKGIRILRQDVWETAFSFIISQNNNIPRIKLCLERVVERFGRFPEPSDVVAGSLAGLKLGYREGYLYDLAERYAPGFTEFRSVKGVGPKVCACIELFALARKDAFPRDVWIKRVEREQFDGRFPEERFPGFAGVMQQYLFYYGSVSQKRGNKPCEQL
ncbi:MAG: hypothetical protein LBC65_04855 [Oscillospiraceae bacterium]|jgi:N-glycosylase/DNA lyase|nr:hypothetical protein [Oscillospiraceae bacterium]